MSYHTSLGAAYTPVVTSSRTTPSIPRAPIVPAEVGRPPVTAQSPIVTTPPAAPSGPSTMMKILLLAGVGVGGFFLYRRFKKGS